MEATDNKQSERDIQTEILRKYATIEPIRLWRANTGAAVPIETVKRAISLLERGHLAAGLSILKQARPVHFGVTGQADLSGIVGPQIPRLFGRRLEIEVKAAKGRQRPEQIAFQAMTEKFGGVYILARHPDDVGTALGL